MKKTVKMVTVEFQSCYVENMNDYIKSLYEQHSKMITIESGYSLERHPSIKDYTIWYDLRKNNEEWSEFVNNHPAYEGFKHTWQYTDYMEIDFKLHKLSVRYTIIDRFEVNVEYDFDLSHINEYIVNSQDSLLKMMEKQVENMNNIGQSLMEGQHFNKKCETPLPDSFLNKVNQVMLLEDTCTDNLQQHIALGWRILAIAPQPNQRRPDYILGKVIDDSQVKTKALRYDDGCY